MNLYATMYETKLTLGQSVDLQTDDTLLHQTVIAAARTIDNLTRRRFYPRYETRNYDAPVEATLPLLLDDDLLAINTLTTDNGDTTITSANYFPMSGYSHNRTPYNMLALDNEDNTWEWSTLRQANAVDGIWGYHNDWSNAWASIDTVQDDPLTDSATDLTVAAAYGVDELGIAPRFQVGQLIRFGSTATAEYAHVTDIVDDTSLTIIRGVNGSTAAQQVNATAIFVYRPQPDIRQAAVMLAAHLYVRRVSLGQIEDRGIVSPTGTLLPQAIPSEVRMILQPYTHHLTNHEQ